MYNKISAEVTDGSGNVIVPEKVIRFNNEINFLKYGAFFQSSKNLFNEKLLFSAGIRTDLNSFTTNGQNPLKTLSPRVSLAYHLHPKWDINASVGTYFKIPTLHWAI